MSFCNYNLPYSHNKLLLTQDHCFIQWLKSIVGHPRIILFEGFYSCLFGKYNTTTEWDTNQVNMVHPI